MDIPRPEIKRKKRIRQIAIGSVVGIVLIVATVGLSRLDPAAPSVARASVWVDTVRAVAEFVSEHRRSSQTLEPGR